MLHTATQSPGMSNKRQREEETDLFFGANTYILPPLSAICKRWELRAPFCQLTGFIYKCLK